MLGKFFEKDVFEMKIYFTCDQVPTLPTFFRNNSGPHKMRYRFEILGN